MNEPKQINLQDILIWIIQNQQDTDAMDKINRATYAYTSKFLSRQNQGYFTPRTAETNNHDASR